MTPRPTHWLWRQVAAAACLGLFLGMSATFGAKPAIAFSFFPLFCWLLEQEPASPKRGFLLGWACGTFANGIVFYWVVGLLRAFAGFPLVAAVPTASLLWLAQGLSVGLVGWVVETSRRSGVPIWFAMPASTIVIFSWIPTIFPWDPSAGLVGWVEWVQMAELGGIPLLNFAMALFGAAAYAAMHQSGLQRRLLIAAACTSMIAPWFYGSIRIEQIRAERAGATLLNVGVVQPNVPIELKGDARLAAGHLRLLRRMTRHLEQNGADVVVWPESAFPYPFERGARFDYSDARAILTQGVRGPILTGALTRRGRCDRWNSVVALDRHGAIQGISDKVQLMHFGETIPLWDVLPPLQERFPCGGIRPGARPQTLALEGIRYGVLNCYEDVLAQHARTVAADTPDLLVNVTNDAWFGDTREPHLHELVSRLRAVETRRDLVRAVNTGVSSHIAATGESIHLTSTFVEDGFIAPVRRLRGQTFWTRYGDGLTPLVAGLLLIVIRRRRSV